jgi:hypothetical protein
MHRISTTPRQQHPPRSKTGCLTCRRRKVRCTEQRPRCGACERLNLQCVWRPVPRGNERNDGRPTDSSHERLPAPEITLPIQQAEPLPFVEEDINGWDFNDLIWQDTLTLSPPEDWLSGVQPDSVEPGSNTFDQLVQPLHFLLTNTTSSTDFAKHSYTSASNANQGDAASPASSIGGSHGLVEHFLASDVPPILASVEVGPRWTSTKMLFASLARKSNMVRNAITAFSSLQLEAQNTAVQSEHQLLYAKASRQLSTFVAGVDSDNNEASPDLPSGLATCFFLAYSDLLTNRTLEACAVLKSAVTMIQSAKSRSLTLTEKRLISWVRLVDGRASSAGGDGAFLLATDGDAYSPDVHQRSASDEDKSIGMTQDADLEIQEILFDILYLPGLTFYQRVQSVMARVSNIDPWHRSRGTVDDETEVMASAAVILKDLRVLEAQRPALMEHAVAGSLNERHLADDIAGAITRSYRTYWANYEAGFIHLHRVAHKHLPATHDVI